METLLFPAHPSLAYDHHNGHGHCLLQRKGNLASPGKKCGRTLRQPSSCCSLHSSKFACRCSRELNFALGSGLSKRNGNIKPILVLFWPYNKRYVTRVVLSIYHFYGFEMKNLFHSRTFIHTPQPLIYKFHSTEKPLYPVPFVDEPPGPGK